MAHFVQNDVGADVAGYAKDENAANKKFITSLKRVNA